MWVLGLLVISLFLLLGGGYERIEKLATIKVGLFTMLTFLCALIMMQQPQNFSWAQIKEGFEFKLPGNGLATAIAVFGITGVGASELFMYPYWCVEKGYARFAGQTRPSDAWRRRALRLDYGDERRHPRVDGDLLRRDGCVLFAGRGHPATRRAWYPPPMT